MPSRSAEIDDVLSSIRKIIDERRPAGDPADARRTQAAKPPALVLSRDHLVSLPVPTVADAPAQGRNLPPAEDSALFGPDPERWVHRPAPAASDTFDADPGRQAAPNAATADGTAPAARTPQPLRPPSVAATGPIPQDSLERIAQAARRASARTQPANADAPVRGVPSAQTPPPAQPQPQADNMFSPLMTQAALPARPGAAAQDDDDTLAEHLADVVRDQIAESLPQQIKALAPHLLDEDILRPVVAEMIRKELSGALGERITQGVRKLVRQELNRAITLRRLE